MLLLIVFELGFEVEEYLWYFKFILFFDRSENIIEIKIVFFGGFDIIFIGIYVFG